MPWIDNPPKTCLVMHLPVQLLPGDYTPDNAAGAGYDVDSNVLGEDALVVNPWTTDNLTIPPAPPLNSDSVDTSVSELQDLLAAEPQVITARGERLVNER